MSAACAATLTPNAISATLPRNKFFMGATIAIPAKPQVVVHFRPDWSLKAVTQKALRAGNFRLALTGPTFDNRNFTQRLFPLWAIFGVNGVLDNCRSPTERVNCTVMNCTVKRQTVKQE